jgi:hypothetical protein
MLQRTKKATVAKLRSRLTTKAVADAFTGATPNADWGHGKLDAKASN